MRKCDLLDFDELLFLGVRLLEGYADVRESLQQRYAHVLVDEYQDVDPVQRQLLQCLSGDQNRLWAVGDGDQAIYAFRGAKSGHLLRFEQHYPNGRVITLERSYRFTPQIAAVASQVIRRNASRRPLTLNAANASGVPVHVVSFPDEHPPRGIGGQTQAALEDKAEQRGFSLYAALGQSEVLSLSQMKAAKLLLALIEDVQRNKTEQSLAQFIAHVADVTGLRQWRIEQDPRHENDLLLLRSIAAKYDGVPTGTALEQFPEEASLAVEVDDYDVSIDAVSLMTIHAAKGLEFSNVMLCGVEEGSLPSENGDLEEERRLFYVGLTRAKERVWLLNCRSRFLFGERRDREPSRFLQEFDDSLKETTIMPDRPRRSKPEPKQLSLLG
ncbi:MAG: AAA family ATPase [Nitrospira sp. SB0677_bin_15]|nr:AAA family ATPase [Nitrospira sp. SB0677_bin_15]MYH03090.1 AAA family ATPase [Nitrospira sp. SB0675_bin_23]